MKLLCYGDFDGTFTKPAIDDRMFMNGCVPSLAKASGLSQLGVKEIARQTRRDMIANPSRYDWTFKGHVTSSLVGDTYLRIIAIIKAVMDECRTVMTTEERDGLGRRLFTDHYPKDTAFRHGTGQFLTQSGVAVRVVTNSSTVKVGAKLSMLLASSEFDGQRDTILNGLRGSAGKHLIDPAFDALPESMLIPGLHRPVLLRRREYFQVLDVLRTEHGTEWESTVTIGDNFELDLAVPWALGGTIILIANEYTPPWEVAFVRSCEKGFVVASLREASAILKRLSRH